jgi:hypothetical protein
MMHDDCLEDVQQRLETDLLSLFDVMCEYGDVDADDLARYSSMRREGVPQAAVIRQIHLDFMDRHVPATVPSAGQSLQLLPHSNAVATPCAPVPLSRFWRACRNLALLALLGFLAWGLCFVGARLALEVPRWPTL